MSILPADSTLADSTHLVQQSVLSAILYTAVAHARPDEHALACVALAVRAPQVALSAWLKEQLYSPSLQALHSSGPVASRLL